MLNLKAPDGSDQPINNMTVVTLATHPAFAFGYLSIGTSANWEQAAVLYLNEVRQTTLFGNYHHYQGIHALSIRSAVFAPERLKRQMLEI